MKESPYTDEFWQKAKQSSKSSNEQDWERFQRFLHKRTNKNKQLLYYKVAAAITLFALVITVFYLNRPVVIHSSEYTADVGNKIINLDDNSSILLEENSSISITERKNNIFEIKLQGNAAFRINSKDSVQLKFKNYSLKGIKSFLLLKSKHPEVIKLYEGEVAVSNRIKKVKLKAPNSYKLDDKIFKAFKNLDRNSFQIILVNDSMRFLIKQLEVVYGIEIKIPEEIKNEKISGRIKYAPIEDVLNAIAFKYNIEMKKIDDKHYEIE